MPDIYKKHLHTNKICELKTQTTHVRVIYDAGMNFSETECPEDYQIWSEKTWLRIKSKSFSIIKEIT